MTINSKIPDARQILLIILLGALGVMGTILYLTRDIKMNFYHQEKWAVIDKDITDPKGLRVVDTLLVTIHPHSMRLPAGTMSPKPTVTINYSKLYFTYNVPFLIWIALISITVGCSLALLPVVIHAIKNIYRSFNQKPVNLVCACAIASAIGVFIHFTNKNEYVLMLFDFMAYGKILLQHPGALNVLIAIGMATGLTAICGQLMINSAITALPYDITVLDDAGKKKAAGDFAYLKTQLKFFLTVDAILIVLSIITTDTLRRAIISEVQVNGTNKGGLFPPEFAYMYGMVFTLYLALLYLPVYYRLRSKGTEMVAGLPDTEASNKLKDGFHIVESPLESFKVALSILAPVATALLPSIIKI